jgi:hypothetical protein
MAILSICLQSRQGRKVISLASDASTQELYESAAKEFGVEIERLKAGFPPKPIPSDKSTPISTFVSNQERVQVEFSTNSTATTTSASPSNNKGSKNSKEKKNSVNNDSNNNSSNDTTRRSKRAASKAATESMPALIKAQEEYLKNAAPSGKKRARGGKSANAINGAFPSFNNKKRPNTTKPVTLSASAGAGRRLADGATVSNPRRAGRQAASRQRLGENGDMSTALMGAIHDKGQMGIILRKGMKNAVLSSYETTRSFSRLAAIQARSYQMTNMAGETSASGGGGGNLLKVTYHGSVDKSKVEETVDCIPRDVLQAVMEGIHASNKEALRPENLSRLSPRVLWSCVQYFPTMSSVPGMYRELLPALDWSFLRRRAEQLSEKALENKRQAMEKEEGLDLERASDVIAAVEHAMEHLQDYHAEERKARQAQAAEARLCRLQAQQDDMTWVLTTPSEPDRDELRECVEASVYVASTTTTTTTTGTTTSAKITKWISQLMKEHKIHNWRELANVSDKRLENLISKLEVPETNLRLWIDNAQNESVSEIMVEICDGNIEAVEILTECARSGTPKDLAGWRSIPDLLLEQLKQKYLLQKNQTHQWMNLGTISTWCDRAHCVLQDYIWLNWYATPV